MAKRRTPPLFEVLGTTVRRPGPPGMAGGMEGRPPVQVHVPRPETARPARDGRTTPATFGSGIRITPGAISMGVAVLLILVLAIWYFAFHLGQDHKQKELEPYLGDGSKSPANPQNPGSPLNPQATPGTPSTPNSQPDLSPPDQTPLIPGADPRKPGMNYLQVATINWKEAEKAAASLTRNGVPAAAVQAKKGIDVADAKAKNLPLLVVVLEGIPSDQFKGSEKARQDMIDGVRRLGKKWKSEENGSSDFSDPMIWGLHK